MAFEGLIAYMNLLEGDIDDTEKVRLNQKFRKIMEKRK